MLQFVLLFVSIVAVFGLLLAFILIIFVWLLWPMIIGAQWVPTSMKVVRRMLELGDVREGDVVIDLGSGDGRIIITAAEEYNARAIGIEADPIRLIWSRCVIRYRGIGERAKVLWGNFLHKDLREATVVTVFQNQGTNNKLKPKFERELKPGTRVISHVFTFDGWEPRKVDKESQIYLYHV
jgi:cyclopropane fatty-acyl-phospholipid synthase-like methyltransferase